MHFYSKVRSIWASQPHRTSFFIRSLWVSSHDVLEMIALASESFTPLVSSRVDNILVTQDCIRTESAAVSVHQRCACLSGKQRHNKYENLCRLETETLPLQNQCVDVLNCCNIICQLLQPVKSRRGELEYADVTHWWKPSYVKYTKV